MLSHSVFWILSFVCRCYSSLHGHCSNITECIPHGVFSYKWFPCQQFYNPYTANMKEMFSRAKPQWKKTLVITTTADELWSHLKPLNKSNVSLINANLSPIHISAPHGKTNRPPSMRWKHESHTSNARHHQARFHSARQSGTAGREKSKQKAGSVLNDPGMWITLVTGEGQH